MLLNICEQEPDLDYEYKLIDVSVPDDINR